MPSSDLRTKKGKVIDLPQLAIELSKLHEELKEKATTAEHHRAVHAVARAKDHASRGNGSEVLTHLTKRLVTGLSMLPPG
jgi:hypothetical protein